MKPILFGTILALLLYTLLEILLRISISLFWGFPFFQPSQILLQRYYPEVAQIKESRTQYSKVDKHILILGGSVISSSWSRMETRLDTLLPKEIGTHQTYKVYNAAVAGHSSRDNVLKYELLQSLQFDLVLYYEAINENRANNIPYDYFKEDYSHIRWYEEIEQIRRHPELNFTVLPYVIDRIWDTVSRKICKQPILEMGAVNPEFTVYGDSIQSAVPFASNLRQLIDLAHNKGEKLLLVNYASYFPDGVELTGKPEDMKNFAGCQFACPVTIWGIDKNVKKGISIHNQITKELVSQYNQLYMSLELPQSAEYFCDVCHVSEKGAVVFANQLTNYIRHTKMLD